jgi:hypothetical protein
MQQSSNGKDIWPDDRPISGAAFSRVESTVYCVLTRFQVRTCLWLVPFYLTFCRVRKEARKVQGLLQAVFLVQSPRVYYTLSLWKDDWAIAEFGPLRSHIGAANSAFAPTYRKDLRRAEIWSAQFRLWAVSSHNLNWEGLDLKSVLIDQCSRRETISPGTGHLP